MVNLLGLKPTPRIVVAACGAGVGLIRDLWKTPGASEYLVAAHMPYSQISTVTYLGFDPDKYVSEETAWHLATTAYIEALYCERTDRNPGNYIGLGLTASIAGLREHRGEHACYGAIVTNCSEETWKLEFVKRTGEEARVADDKECSEVACSVFTRPRMNDPAAITAFMSRPYFQGRARDTVPPEGCVFFPGAFNPMHEGHRAIVKAVAASTGRPVVPMITIDPPHKPALTIQEMCRRVVQIGNVLFTSGDPLYIDKARRYPGRGFVIGADALLRMLDPKWGPSIPEMLAEFRSLGTRFYVVGRVVDGKYTEFKDLSERVIGYRDMFYSVPGRWDVSSTEIRNATTV